MHKITFKTKVREWVDGGQYVEMRATLRRMDCTMRPPDHDYYNSDLFVPMLNGHYRRIIGQHTARIDMDKLPAGVSVDTSKFLAVVSIDLPRDFHRSK